MGRTRRLSSKQHSNCRVRARECEYINHLNQSSIKFVNYFRAHKPCSHSKIGWETFTDVVIKMISAKRTGCVFLLWGAYAQTKAEFIDPSKHMIIACAHPSPYSAHRFFYSKCFSKTNSYLASIRKKPINWSLQ